MKKFGSTSFPENWMNSDFEEGLVSVIVPTHNHAHLIVEALDSVWNQVYRPIELIIVNDGSTDSTESVVESWLESHNSDETFKATYLRQENSGVCAARNYALSVCHGEFIQFLDSDDLIHHDRFEKVVDVFIKKDVEYIETGFEGYYQTRGDSSEVHFGHEGKDQVALLLQGTLWPNTLRPTYRRSLVVRTGPWNEAMITLQDYEFVIRALVQSPAIKAESIREVLASARRDHGPRMSDIIKTREGRELRIHCESLLCDRVKNCDYISNCLKQDLASRLYALGFRSNAAGWPDLGAHCVDLAESLNVKLDSLGRRRRFVYRAGPWAARVYDWAHGIKVKYARGASPGNQETPQ